VKKAWKAKLWKGKTQGYYERQGRRTKEQKRTEKDGFKKSCIGREEI